METADLMFGNPGETPAFSPENDLPQDLLGRLLVFLGPARPSHQDPWGLEVGFCTCNKPCPLPWGAPPSALSAPLTWSHLFSQLGRAAPGSPQACPPRAAPPRPPWGVEMSLTLQGRNVYLPPPPLRGRSSAGTNR